VSALQVLAAMKRTGQPLSELAAGMPHYPQVMVNVRVQERTDPSKSAAIQAAVQSAERQLGASGRVVLRASGTEPVIRVMVEGREPGEVNRLANELAETVRKAV
jgi:phosphoglucosamine mutase